MNPSKAKTNLVTKIFGKMNASEILFLGLGTALIELKIEGIFWQSILSALVLLITFAVVLDRATDVFDHIEFTQLIQKKSYLKLLGIGFIFTLFAFTIISPDPAHAVLFKAEQAVTTAITTNVDAEVAGVLNKIIISLLWVGRLVLLAILIQMGLKVNEAKGQEKNWKELLENPVIFIVSIGIINQIATLITVGAVAP